MYCRYQYTKEQVEVYTKSFDADEVACIKGVGDIEAKPQELIDVLQETTNRVYVVAWVFFQCNFTRFDTFRSISCIRLAGSGCAFNRFSQNGWYSSSHVSGAS